MERGVFIGGLMVCGSFLLAALLNRSALEEVPTAAPAAPAAVGPPISPIPSEAEVAPGEADCAEVAVRLEQEPAVTPAELPAPNGCDHSRVPLHK